MLLSFRAANVFSIRDEQTLSFVATELNDGSARPTKIREGGRLISAVPVIGIYGANASGKTKVLEALVMMQSAVLRSADWFKDPAPVRRIPFLLDKAFIHEPSFFEVDLDLGGTRYTYGFELDEEGIRGEWLHAYPRGRRQVWFEREDDGEIAFPGEGLRGEKLELARRTRPDALFLTTGALYFNHAQLAPVVEWFRDRLWLMTPEWPGRGQREIDATVRVMRNSELRDRVGRLLEVADLGITGIDVVSDPVAEKVQFRHRTRQGQVRLDYNSESMGTRSWFTLAVGLIQALETGTVALVDELDASLHPDICAEAVRMFEDPDVNTRGAQLLFTTHDITLLRMLTGGGRVLDRDSIWLTEKDDGGGTSLYPLSGFSPAPRKDDNLLRRYLLGAYGGRPRIAPGALAREAAEELDEP
jgi:hypothetical protein